MTIILPWPPALNHYYRYGRGHHYIADKGRKYRQVVCATVARNHLPKLTGNVVVDIQAILPDKRRRDVDGLLKCVLDSLGHAGIYNDDSQIVKLSIAKRHKTGDEEPGLIVEVSETD